MTSDTFLRIRVTSGERDGPVWIRAPSGLKDLEKAACAALGLDSTTRTYCLDMDGTRVLSADVLRDGDLLVVCEEESAWTMSPAEEDWVSLNVGGVLFTTTSLTLTSTEPQSILAKMLGTDGTGRPSWKHRKDAHGAILVDRSGDLFRPLLDYLRTGRLVVSERQTAHLLYAEAEFYNFENLLRELRPHVNAAQTDRKVIEMGSSGNTITLTRSDVIRALMVTPSTQELRFQGMDFEGCDLSKLDLRCINFKMCNLRGTNLSYANLSNAHFDRADLSDAILDHAVMFGVKMPCAVMERCSMQDVNTDDPAGLRANFEGVNLRSARIDNSQLNGANFRVANLKFASMKNCELKQASFPGANMELCDLSGSNLFEANLRGANLLDTNFGHLANALHMSQTI